jgi:hypothetical protein
MLEVMEFQNETQDPSTPVSRAGENAREPSSAQDDTGWVSWDCLEHDDSEFKTILRVLAEC